MSSIGQAFIAQIQSIPAVTAQIAERVYPAYVYLADKTFPLAAYKIDNGTTSASYDGTVNQLRSCNIVISCIGGTYAQADGLKEALLTAFDGTAGTWGTTVVQGCFLNEDGISEDTMTEPETEEILYYITEVTFLVWYVAS